MSRIRFRAAPAALITAMVTATSVALWQPAVSHAQDSEACALQPGGHAQDNEWLSCLRVWVELGTLPAVGDQAVIGFDVTAQYARPGLTVEAQLPSNLDWVSLPEGFESRDSHLATGRVSLGANETRRFTGTVRATSAGGAEISVRAAAPPVVDPEDGSMLRQEAAADRQFLTIAEAGGRSTPGIEGRPDSDAAPSQSTSEPTLVTPWLEHNPVPQQPQRLIMAPGQTSCVKGSFGYQEGTVGRLAPNMAVEVWDSDFWDADDLLVTTLTDAQGAYNLCFPTDDPDGPFADFGQDVYVMFSTTNTRWRVQETGTGKVFSWAGPIAANLAANATKDFGYLQPGDPKYHLGVQAFDAVNDFWKWKPGACWDANDTAANCKQVVINWRWDSAVGTNYDKILKQVLMNKDHPKYRMVTVHEAAHAAMDDAYEGAIILGAGGPHYLPTATNKGLAWVEGFADWVAATVYKSQSLQMLDGTMENLEKPTWGQVGWDTNDITEGRVAGALMDISDGAQEAPWDRLNEGLVPGNIWTTLLGPAVGPPRVQQGFKDFWTHRGLDGFVVTQAAGVSTLYQSTIDYDFRDPIANHSPQLRPHPLVPHRFSFNTTTWYWSAIATRPAPGSNQNLRVYEDAGLTNMLGQSNLSASIVDFVAIDSNKKTLTDYYPEVVGTAVAGSCRIELAQGSLSLSPNSTQTVAMGANNVVAVRDTFISAGATVTIKVTPTVAGQDPELFMMSSTAGQPLTYVRSRGQAVATASANGPGLAETFMFQAPVTDWYGVVITNRAGGGSYTLQRIG